MQLNTILADREDRKINYLQREYGQFWYKEQPREDQKKNRRERNNYERVGGETVIEGNRRETSTIRFQRLSEGTFLDEHGEEQSVIEQDRDLHQTPSNLQINKKNQMENLLSLATYYTVPHKIEKFALRIYHVPGNFFRTSFTTTEVYCTLQRHDCKVCREQGSCEHHKTENNHYLKKNDINFK